jgi:hypothetical protein
MATLMGVKMFDVMDNSAFWTLVGDFGPGILTMQLDGMPTRPVLPVVDRALGQITCLFERDWLGSTATFGISCALAFFNEFSCTSLQMHGNGRLSSRSDDIAAGWNTISDRCYPNGLETVGLTALLIVPRSAYLWQLGQIKPISSWQFVNGLIEAQDRERPVPNRHAA